MNISYRTDKNILYVAVEGRVDASNASEAEKQILEIRNANADKHLVIDAIGLEYLSSAGLRVILKLRKVAPKLAIINVNSEVYDVFDMTGFTEMVTIEKAYSEMSTEGCEFIAKGANGAVYRYDDETILKLYFAKDALPEIKQERDNARRAFVLGINTAIPYGIVRVGDGYGTVAELLKADSISNLVRDNPQDLTQAVTYFVDMLKSVHAIEAEDGEFPDMKQTALSWADFVSAHIPEAQAKKLRSLIEAVPKQNTVLHGDYHTNNVMVQNGEPILIDMDTLCMGHPIFELGSMYNAFQGYAELDHKINERFYGYTYEAAARFWKLSLQQYLGTEDEAVCQSVEEKAMVIGYIRMLRRSIRRPNEEYNAIKIAHYKEVLAKLLANVESLTF